MSSSPPTANAGSLPRVAVVGAGPAGVRAAQALVEAGLRPVVIDEGQRDGGQIYRRQPEGFKRDYATLYGSEAAKATALHRDFEALRPMLDYRSETLAWNVTAGHLHTVHPFAGETAEVAFDALIVCSGAIDRLMPVEGWNLAGCYSLGAAQIALKAQGCAIGSRVAFLGSGPLLYLVAAQYLKAGARVEAVLDTAPALPPASALVRLFRRPRLMLRGMALIARLKRAGVRIRNDVVPVCILGTPDEGVSGVVVRDARGALHEHACDAVGMGWHLRAEAQLADLAGCEFAFEPLSRQWLPRIDDDGRSSIRNVYLAGDGAKILGADRAETAGRLAALAALHDLGYARGSTRYAAEHAGLRRTLATMNAFHEGLAQAFPWPHAHAASLADAAVVCRCEVVTAGELRHCVRELGSSEVNRAKAFSRIGMGRCQGRYCDHAAAEIIAAAADIPVEQAGRIRTQAPVKPLNMNTREVAATEASQ